MFPPKKTNDWLEAADNLLKSMKRAGDQLLDEFVAIEGDGENVIVYKLWHVLPAKAIGDINKYIRGYLELSGWKVRSIRHRKFDIRVTVYPAHGPIPQGTSR